MPKSFSDTERDYIKKRLMEEAQDCLVLFGIRKTTVDELVKRVNIPKGTFYLFYPSKESLFFDLFCTLQDQLQADLLQRIGELKDNINADTVTELIFHLYKQIDTTFLHSFVLSGDLELLMRKLPPEAIGDHVQRDDFSMEQLLGMLPGAQAQVHGPVFSAALRAIFCTLSHRQEIGEEVFDDVIRMMLRGVVTQLFEEER